MFIRVIYNVVGRELAHFFLAWSQNMSVIDRLRIFSGNPNNQRYAEMRARVSPYYVTLTLIVMATYCARAAAFVFLSIYYGTTKMSEHSGWQWFFLKAGLIYHESARLNMQITIMLWTLNFILVYIPQYRLRLLPLSWLAVFTMQPNGNITPEDLGISLATYHRVAYYRRRVFQLIHYNNILIAVSCITFEFSLTWYYDLFRKDFVYRFLSCVFMFFFPFLAGSPEYGSPYYLYTLTYYLREKQNKTLSSLRTLNLRGHQLIRKMEGDIKSHKIKDVALFSKRYRSLLFGNYLRLQTAMLRTCREAKDYTDFWQYYLTIILSTYNITIIYNCYLIFLNDLPTGFDLIYRLVFVTHVFLLVVIIYSCCRVPIMVSEFGRECTHFHNCLNRLGLLLPGELLKAEMITENMRQFQFGFRLWNAFLLNSNAYQTIFFNMATFFFLFFRSNYVV